MYHHKALPFLYAFETLYCQASLLNLALGEARTKMLGVAVFYAMASTFLF